MVTAFCWRFCWTCKKKTRWLTFGQMFSLCEECIKADVAELVKDTLDD